jgi:hypothetical protein
MAAEMRAKMKVELAEALLLRAGMTSHQVPALVVKKSKEELGPGAFVQRMLLRRLFASKGKPK